MPTPKAEKKCPDLQQYQWLAEGQLSAAEQEALLRHLEGCAACASRLSKQPEQDSLAKLLREAQTISEQGSRETIAALVTRLSKLRPRSTPEPAKRFSCPGCGKGMKISEELAGKQVKCPNCQRILRVPEAATPAPATTVEYYPAPATNGPGELEKPAEPKPGTESERSYRECLNAPEAPDELGRLGPYRVLKVLGSGGMGVVFQAEDPQLLRLVALKAMLPTLAVSDNARQRFLREARAAAAIRHDHIVTVYQVSVDRGTPYLAMELLEGEPLDKRLRREGKVPAAEVLRVGREVALGLAAAHQRGLVHRDIKPANIWLEAGTGRVKILDFGLARGARESADLTYLGAVVGTPGFMAPEQAQSKSVDHRCDLFSLGCVLYRMATGKLAFHGTDLLSTLMAVSTHHPPPPHTLDAALPPALSELIMSLLEKEPKDRPPSAQAVVEALEHIAAAGAASRAALGPPSPSSVQPGRPTVSTAPGPRKKGPLLAALAGSVLLGAALLLGAIGVFRLKTRDGTIVLKNLPAEATVLVDGETVTVEWGKDASAAIRITPGKKHQLQIENAGLRLLAEAVEIDAGRVQTISVGLEPAQEPEKGPPPAGPEKKLPPPSAELEALRRDRIPLEALAMAGDGDPKRAPASLVGVLGEPQPIQWGYVRALAFSGDGRWLASGCDDNTIVLREAATGQARKLLRGHLGSIRSVAFSKDCKTLASASIDGTVKLWPMEQVGGPQTLRPGLGEIWVMALSADGRYMAVGGTSGGVKLWKWDQRMTMPPLDLPADPKKAWSSFTGWKNNHSLALSSDGHYLAIRTQETSTDAPVYLFDTANGKLVKILAGTWSGDDRVYYPMGMTFSTDGKYLASWASDRKATVWEVDSGKRCAEFPSAQFGAIALSPDNTKVALVRSFAIGVEVHDLATQRQERVLMHRNKDGMSVAFSPDGKTLAAGFYDGAVYLWNTTTWEEKYPAAGHNRSIHSVQLRFDGRSVLSASDDSSVREWDLGRPGQNRIRRRVETRLGTACYSPDGKKYVTLTSLPWPRHDAQALTVWDSATDSELFVGKPLVVLDGIAFSPDGSYLAGSSWPGNDPDRGSSVYLWNAETGAELHHFGSPGDGQPCIPVFSTDGKLLAAVSEQQVKVWQVTTGREVHVWQDYRMCTAAFSPDGQDLVIGHSNGKITIWDLAGQKMKKTLAGHTARVQSLRFTPDGKRLVSSGHDGTIRLWNPEWERAVDVIALGSRQGRWVMDIDPSGKYLVAAGPSSLIFLLRLPQR